MISIFKILQLINKKHNITLNEFLNIKDIPKQKNYLITLDNKIMSFIKVNPFNTDLLSSEEQETKMDLMSIEFANEQYSYKILVIPRTVDISEHIHEQEELKNKCKDEVSKKIVAQRMEFIMNLVSNKDIIENEFYIVIWEENYENAEVELNKRANNWISRLKNCEYTGEILKETDIIFLIKSFTIPEFAREETYYGDNIVQIKRKEKVC
ncbi:MAG: hypothetical protein HFJ49_01315 [Clostridia bacterium]|nr:hypothetical protein [Clostridia bacterium]